jgi:Tfp pilus assembly protein PilV
MIVRKGSSIIEVLIAATLISMGVLAALSLSSQNQKQTDSSRYLNTATFDNTQALDWLRNMRTQLGWADFVQAINNDKSGSDTKYCLNTLPADTAGFTSLSYAATCGTSYIAGTTYQREMTISLDGTQTNAIVKVTTWWLNRAHSASSETTLSKW